MDFIPEHIPDSDRVGVLKALDKALESGEAMDPEFRDILEANRNALLDAIVHADTAHGEAFSIFLNNLIEDPVDNFPDFPPISETSLPEMFEEYPDVLANTKLSDEQIQVFPQLLLDQPQKALILGWFSGDVRLVEPLFSYYKEDPHSPDSSSCIPLFKFIIERFPHSPQVRWLMSQVQDFIFLPQTEDVLSDLFSLYVCLRTTGGFEGNNARILQRIFGVLDKVSYPARSLFMDSIAALGDRDAVLGLRSLYVTTPGLREDIEQILKEWQLPQAAVDQYLGSHERNSKKQSEHIESISSFEELSTFVISKKRGDCVKFFSDSPYVRSLQNFQSWVGIHDPRKVQSYYQQLVALLGPHARKLKDFFVENLGFPAPQPENFLYQPDDIYIALKTFLDLADIQKSDHLRRLRHNFAVMFSEEGGLRFSGYMKQDGPSIETGINTFNPAHRSLILEKDKKTVFSMGLVLGNVGSDKIIFVDSCYRHDHSDDYDKDSEYMVHALRRLASGMGRTPYFLSKEADPKNYPFSYAHKMGVRDDSVELELDFPLLDILRNLHTVSACRDVSNGLSVGFEYMSFPGRPVQSSLFSLPLEHGFYPDKNTFRIDPRLLVL